MNLNTDINVNEETAEICRNLLNNNYKFDSAFANRIKALPEDKKNVISDIGMLILYKSIGNNMDLLKTSNFLLDNDICNCTSLMLSYVITTGYQLELMLDKMNDVSSSINKCMEDFYFDEKIVIKNEQAEAIYDLIKKIISKSSSAELQDAVKGVQTYNIDTSKIKFLNESPNYKQTEVKQKLKF